MANPALFQTRFPRSNSVNNAGGKAYAFSAEHALAQLAVTGCLTPTFYQSDEVQLDTVLNLASQVDPKYVAQVAIYARQRGYMKDMPALLTAYLAAYAPQYLESVFKQVIDNGKMLRNFVQIMRSGVTGRRSLGSFPKRLVREWFAERKPATIFRNSIGKSPSMADVIKMVHPKPEGPEYEALYGYLIGRPVDAEHLPEVIKELIAYRNGETAVAPKVPFQMLTSTTLSKEQWVQIARDAPWQMTRMNLNTFLRHGVFDSKDMIQLVARRLRNPELVRAAKVYPYQLMVAYLNVSSEMPRLITEALQDAMEIAIENIPTFEGQVYVMVDISGSMGWSVTGWRETATSKVRCVDVAALMAAAVLRKNPDAIIIPFDGGVRHARFNSRDSIMTNAEKLTAMYGGATNCAAPLEYLNKKRAAGDLVIYVSDNESWIDKQHYGATATMMEWATFKKRNRDAKMVCIDIVPNTTSQAPEQKDIVNLGGFSDQSFTLIDRFAKGELDAGPWVKEIKALEF